jgi:hypothetical protein
MADPDSASSEIVDHAVGAVAARRMVMSSRDILPVASSDIIGNSASSDKVSRAHVRRLRRDVASSAAQVASADISPVTKRRLRSSGQRAIKPLLETETAQEALEYASDTSAPEVEPEAVFWSSKSVLLNVPKDSLAALPDEVPQIRDVYRNRPLQIPSTVKVTRLPDNVQDNKASVWGVHAIGAMAAWGGFDARGRTVKVAILDTGVDSDHPDLQGKLAGFAEFDVDGREVLGAQPRDSDQHGTHVAGTVVGGRESGQWIGVAPEAKILAGLVLDGARGGSDAQVLAGIDWALEQGADVINMSLGGLTLGPEVPATYTEAIVTALRAGVPVITAIGNEGSQTSGSPGNDLFAFAVGATDPEDRSAGFSGGRTQVIFESSFISPELLPLPYSKPDLSAPGVAVTSAVPGGGYEAFSGTSMATPHVAGAVALLLSATNKLRSVAANQRAFLIQDLLMGSVEELGESGQDHRFGFGRLDILRAIGFAKDGGF